MSSDGLAGFRRAVLADPALQRELLNVPGRQEFVTLLVLRARSRGWDVDADDVEEALRNSRRAWEQRWI